MVLTQARDNSSDRLYDRSSSATIPSVSSHPSDHSSDRPSDRSRSATAPGVSSYSSNFCTIPSSCGCSPGSYCICRWKEQKQEKGNEKIKEIYANNCRLERRFYGRVDIFQPDSDTSFTNSSAVEVDESDKQDEIENRDEGGDPDPHKVELVLFVLCKADHYCPGDLGLAYKCPEGTSLGPGLAGPCTIPYASTIPIDLDVIRGTPTVPAWHNATTMIEDSHHSPKCTRCLPFALNCNPLAPCRPSG